MELFSPLDILSPDYIPIFFHTSVMFLDEAPRIFWLISGDFWQVTLLEAEPELGGKSLTVYDDAQPSVPQESLGWDSSFWI